MSDHAPPLGFRVAVVVGGAALLMGLAGAVFLAIRSGQGESVLGPGAYARVRLVGVPDHVTPHVSVRWTTSDDTTVMVPALRLDEAPDVWVLTPPIPREGPLTVAVTDMAADPPLVIQERVVEVEGAQEVTVDLGATAPGN